MLQVTPPQGASTHIRAGVAINASILTKCLRGRFAATGVARSASGREFVVSIVALDVARERDEVVDREVAAGAAVTAAIAVAGVDAVALLAADREPGASCWRVAVRIL